MPNTGARTHGSSGVPRSRAADVPLARTLAAELEMEISVDKGWVVGEDGIREASSPRANPPVPLPFLWRHAVVNNDSGVAPSADLHRRTTAGGSPPEAPERRASASLNNDSRWRRFFDARTGTTRTVDVCFDCPITVTFEGFNATAPPAGGARTFACPTRPTIASTTSGTGGPTGRPDAPPRPSVRAGTAAPTRSGPDFRAHQAAAPERQNRNAAAAV
jgi:hypothetical protein